jgi:hypothetical protein
MSFEPYGIGIRKDRALSMGIREVLYYDPDDADQPGESMRWRSQSIGTRTDWRNEKEYRARGDVDLSGVPIEYLLAFCHYPRQAAEIVTKTGIAAMSIRARD